MKMSDQELETVMISQPFGEGVPAKFHQIRDALFHQLAPVGTGERAATLALANLVFALRTEPSPDQRVGLHAEMLTAVDKVRKMQREREEKHARGEEA